MLEEEEELYWALGEGRGWALQLQTAKGKTM